MKKSKNAHILNISPPLNLNSNWFKDHVAYTMAKYGMSMCVLGMAAELGADNISVNALWPRTGNYIKISCAILNISYKLKIDKRNYHLNILCGELASIAHLSHFGSDLFQLLILTVFY